MSDLLSITSRTEYLGRAHRLFAVAAAVLLAAALVALVVLRAIGVDSTTVIVVCGGGVAACVVTAAIGLQLHRPAVILTVDDSSVYLGNEDVTVEEFALMRLRSVTSSAAVATDTSPMTGSAARRLTIKGHHYVQLEVARTDSMPGFEEAVDRWQVAFDDSDPGAHELVARLRARAPRQKATAAAVQASGPRMARVADAGTDEAAERLWEAATRIHDGVMSEYAPYELDADLSRRSPAITDVTRPAVQRFQEAMDAAEALRTDRFPDDRDYADRYQRAVFVLRDAWARCRAELSVT